MSMEVSSEDGYISAIVYDAGRHTFTKEQVGTRYVGIGLRTLVNPEDPEDVEQVHALQDAVRVEQKAPGSFDTAAWDLDSQKKVRDALIVLYNLTPDQNRVFGGRGEVGGSVTVQFGGYDGKTANCLPVLPGWNYMVRLYRPRAEILSGSWKFPKAQIVQ
jgi:hypothetical protein